MRLFTSCRYVYHADHNTMMVDDGVAYASQEWFRPKYLKGQI